MAETFPFLIVLALGPLAIYFLTLAFIHFSGKVFIVSGERDWIALALALIGCIFAGPVELFFPNNGMVRFGWGVWLALLGLYLLPVILIALNLRPQWVIYGCEVTRIGEALLAAALKQDPAANAHQEFVDLPTSGLRLRVEGTIGGASGRVSAISSQVPLKAWRQLRQDFQASLDQQPRAQKVTAVTYLTMSAVLLGFLSAYVWQDPTAVARAIAAWINH